MNEMYESICMNWVEGLDNVLHICLHMRSLLQEMISSNSQAWDKGNTRSDSLSPASIIQNKGSLKLRHLVAIIHESV